MRIQQSKIISYSMNFIMPGTAKCSTVIILLDQQRIGGCVPCMLATRTVSAVSTLTALRTTTAPAIPLGSPPASAFKLISSSPLSRLRRKPGQIMDDEHSNQVERKEDINESFAFTPWLCWSG